MTEGELRETIAKAALEGYRKRFAKLERWVLSPDLPDMHDARNIADAVLGVLRPHLGPGVTLTAEEIEHITYILDWYFTDAQKRATPEQLVAIDSFKRWARTSAIAGRGEGEGQ